MIGNGGVLSLQAEKREANQKTAQGLQEALDTWTVAIFIMFTSGVYGYNFYRPEEK